MKKAKKLIAVLLAVVMLASAACLPVYARTATSSYSKPDHMTNNQKYYFNAEQGCTWLLDSLDEMLSEAYLVLSWDNLLNNDTLGGVVDSIIGRDNLDFTSVDNAVQTIYDLVLFVQETMDNAFWRGLINLIGGVGDLGELDVDGLSNSIKRGSRDNPGSSDMLVLYNVVNWLGGNESLHNLLMKLITGSADFGLLDGTIKGLEIAGMPLLEDIDKYVPILLYQLLVDDTVTADTMPAGETIESGLQKVINWALIDGTGEAPENGGTSILGPNFKALIGNALTHEQVDLDLGVYELVNNLINGLLNGMLAPMLGDLIADLVGIEEDGSIDDATTFNLIIGVVEGLLVDNGADPPVYSGDEATRTPQSIINDLVKWLFEDGALQVFIKTDISGIGLTDNFMSLLQDLIRLAINLLPALGLEIPDGLLPSADALTDFYYYKNIVDPETGDVIGTERCLKTDPDKADQLYQTYYGKKACIAVYNDEGEIEYYKYFDGQQLPVNTADTTAADYENPDFIRPYYLMSMDQVWAAVMKAVFSLFLEGPYFPEWATTMEAVLAYGCAGLAVAILPEGDWYDRLDAWHITGSKDPYEIRKDDVVIPLPYSDPEKSRTTTQLPTGALEIISGVAAYYLNTMLDLSANQKFTTIGTSFEQLFTELGIWAMTKYLPALAGELNPSTGLVYTTEHTDAHGATRYPGTFAANTNELINACYSNFATREELANPNWHKIYDYLNSTLLSLIPADWLPAQYYDSYTLFNDWLFGNIVNFDLQGILGILSANNQGELTQPLLTVLLRVIDRVLATVFGGDAVMLPVDRNQATKPVFTNHTSVTTLTQLLEDGDGDTNASLPQFVHRLLYLLNKHKGILLGTLMPLLIGGQWEKPYDRDILGQETDFVNTLGNDLSRYKIEDLENQIRTLTKNVNAIRLNRQTYSSLTTVEYGTYATAEEAAAAQAALGDAYCSTVEVDGGFLVNRHLNADDVLAQYKAQYGEDADIYVETIERVAGTSTSAPIYEFNVYESKDYFSSATMSEATDDAGTYYVFSDFNYKSINPSSATNPLVTWDNGAYYFWESEDTNPYAYYYSNYNEAIEEAQTFVDSYKSIATSTLPDAFGAWFEYSIDAFCVAADIYDSNLDGKSIISSSDGDYVADNADTTDVNEETPVDGYPSAPEAMYPYYNADDPGNLTWLDSNYDAYVTQARNSFRRSGETTAYPGYEILNMAEAYGNDHANDVLLDPYYTEKVVRYALWANNGNNTSEALKFDITANADGSFTGNGTASRQWANLSETEIGYVRDLCTSYFMNLKQNAETGEYEIYRWAFTYGSNLQYPKVDGAADLDPMPIASRHYIGDDGPTDFQEAQNAMYDGFVEYASTLYNARRSIYNQLGILNWRMEEAEKNRSTALDTTMLEWALQHVDHAYISADGLRNLKYQGTVDGEDVYTKVYTSTSYAAFQKAYDYAKSLSKSGIGAGQVSGTTQSMVTMAFQKLLAAYNALVEYLGDADWVQYKAYLALAQQIAKPVSEGGNADHPTLGLQPESRQALADIITQAIDFSGELTEAGDAYRKENFDCERQEEIDAMASSINAVILNLKYLSNPNLIIADGSDNLKLETGTEVDNDGNVHTYGWIIGLKEGEGLSLDNVTEVGMLINEGKGDYLALEESAKGVGTGARIDGYINTYSRFRYYGVLYGDLNGDARVDGTDWAKLSYYLLTNPDSPTVGFPETHVAEAADANHEGGITIADADLIKAHYNYSKTINQNESGTGTATTGL